MKKTWVLAAGNAGYTGLHVLVQLIVAGFGVFILDKFENVAPDVSQRLEEIVGADEALGWRGELSLERVVSDHWAFQRTHRARVLR